MHTLDDTSHPAKIEPALPIQAAEKKQTGSDTFDFSLSQIAFVHSKTTKKKVIFDQNIEHQFEFS